MFFFSGKIMEIFKLYDILVGCVLFFNMFVVNKVGIYGFWDLVRGIYYIKL